ncbi:MAG: hypothetical protein RL020_238 [Pseudomonadota bacterium]|jgi:hypothetical protein
MTQPQRDSSQLFAPPTVSVERRSHGSVILRSLYAVEDSDAIGFLIFASANTCRILCADLPSNDALAQVLSHSAVREKILMGLQVLAHKGSGSSTYAKLV